MRRRPSTPVELDDAIAAFNAMADIWNAMGWIPTHEPGSEFPVMVLEPLRVNGRVRSLRFRLTTGSTFDLYLKPGCRHYGGGGAVTARPISLDDVRKAYVIESRVRFEPGEPAF